ncbi:hypothetical protein BP6252_00480 [Coleophoma cylindrospora]|uniref:Uncharacterized protein n=1 Tax=Coleophoma cylindrospora TaxID=1849047 RepID=A0A3D8SRM7_9HELO|nr:hypothetical protein BP6252_00480 [Coleophoma cylindrospora]
MQAPNKPKLIDDNIPLLTDHVINSDTENYDRSTMSQQQFSGIATSASVGEDSMSMIHNSLHHRHIDTDDSRPPIPGKYLEDNEAERKGYSEGIQENLMPASTAKQQEMQQCPTDHHSTFGYQMHDAEADQGVPGQKQDPRSIELQEYNHRLPTEASQSDDRNFKPGLGISEPIRGWRMWKPRFPTERVNLTDAQSIIDQKNQEIKNLTESLHRKDCQFRQADQDRKQLAWELQSTTNNHHAEIAGIRQALHARDAVINEKDNNNRHLGSQLTRVRAAYRRNLEKEQERLSKQIQSGGWLPEDETKVVSQIQALNSLMKSWAKSFSIQIKLSPGQFMDPDGAGLLKELEKVIVMEDGRFPAALCLQTLRIPGLLLNALLAHSIYVDILGDPFFIFTRDEYKRDTKGGASLREVYEDMAKVNSREAQLWRANTLRSLFPSKLSQEADEQKLRDKTNQRISDGAGRYTKRFVKSYAVLLLKEGVCNEDNPGFKRLRGIFQQAAELSYSLWTRKNKIIIYTALNSYRNGFMAGAMEQHPLAQKDEEGEEVLKGAPVKVVVHPCVQASGNDDGEGYENMRTWTKAVVWAVPPMQDPNANASQNVQILVDLDADELHGSEPKH